MRILYVIRVSRKRFQESLQPLNASTLCYWSDPAIEQFESIHNDARTVLVYMLFLCAGAGRYASWHCRQGALLILRSRHRAHLEVAKETSFSGPHHHLCAQSTLTYASNGPKCQFGPQNRKLRSMRKYPHEIPTGLIELTICSTQLDMLVLSLVPRQCARTDQSWKPETLKISEYLKGRNRAEIPVHIISDDTTDATTNDSNGTFAPSRKSRHLSWTWNLRPYHRVYFSSFEHSFWKTKNVSHIVRSTCLRHKKNSSPFWAQHLFLGFLFVIEAYWKIRKKRRPCQILFQIVRSLCKCSVTSHLDHAWYLQRCQMGDWSNNLIWYACDKTTGYRTQCYGMQEVW
jgi:hypothetical protein